MPASQNLVAFAYCNAERVVDFSHSQWDLLIRQARSANMLARLCVHFEAVGLQSKIPSQALIHLQSAKIAVQALHRSVRWEVDCVLNALANSGVPVILLKGAAYTVAGLSAGGGRQFEDLDIMVPKEDLDTVERKLLLHGWVTTHNDAYDQRYYRQWMHELPPMRHVKRQSSLDVHHTILPETARLHPDPKKLFAKAKLIENDKPLYILSNPDMVLHSATHLFHDGELHNGFRDLTDLDLLLHEFGQDAEFWPKLLNRAQELDLTIPLYYALRYTTRILRTPVPAAIMNQCQSLVPARIKLPLMDFLFQQGLQPDHPTCNDHFNGLARWILYIRSHYLRMPLRLLIPHLLRKAVVTEQH